jgi:hypothetical protein
MINSWLLITGILQGHNTFDALNAVASQLFHEVVLSGDILLLPVEAETT